MHPRQLRRAFFSAALFLFAVSALPAGAEDFPIGTKIEWVDQGKVDKDKACVYQDDNCTDITPKYCAKADGTSSPPCKGSTEKNNGMKLHSAIQVGDCITPTPPTQPTGPKCDYQYRCAVIVLYKDLTVVIEGDAAPVNTCENPMCLRDVFRLGQIPTCEPGTRVITYGEGYGPP